MGNTTSSIAASSRHDLGVRGADPAAASAFRSAIAAEETQPKVGSKREKAKKILSELPKILNPAKLLRSVRQAKRYEPFAGADPQGAASGADPQDAASGADPQGAASGADPQGAASGADPQGAASGADPQGAPSGAGKPADRRSPPGTKARAPVEAARSYEPFAVGPPQRDAARTDPSDRPEASSIQQNPDYVVVSENRPRTRSFKDRAERYVREGTTMIGRRRPVDDAWTERKAAAGARLFTEPNYGAASASREPLGTVSPFERDRPVIITGRSLMGEPPKHPIEHFMGMPIWRGKPDAASPSAGSRPPAETKSYTASELRGHARDLHAKLVGIRTTHPETGDSRLAALALKSLYQDYGHEVESLVAQASEVESGHGPRLRSEFASLCDRVYDAAIDQATKNPGKSAKDIIRDQFIFIESVQRRVEKGIGDRRRADAVPSDA